jgi:two-component system chemotaxis sensor kinase CheA
MDGEFDLQALFAVFTAEAEECLEAMQSGLLALEERPHASELVDQIFRAAHTMKGNSGSLGFQELSSFAHGAENLLDRVRSKEIAVTPALITLLLNSVDAMRRWLPDLRIGQDNPMDVDTRSVHDALAHFGEEAAMPVASAAEQTSGPAAAFKTIRVETSRMDALLTLSGEVAIAAERVRRRAAELGESEQERMADAVEDLERLLREVHDTVMRSRMVSVGPVFRRHVRAVRDLAAAKGKQVRLIVEGEDVEVDVSVMEALSDPLLHMIRNSIDHGIESPETRLAAGKQERGTIKVRAFHDRASIVVQLSDDGAGIQRDRVRQRAQQLGLPAESLRNDELLELIFEPGFSTAEVVTETSGRGVGMDVVRRNLERVRGQVTLESTEGVGTTITMRLPLTLAVIPGFVIGVAGEQFVVPMAAVSECLLLPEELPGQTDAGGVLNLRGEAIPYVRLRHFLGFGGEYAGREVMVVIDYDRGRAAFVVDEVFGEAQTVIKPLTSALRNLPGVTGTAIMGDGAVTMVLEPTAIFRDVEQSTAA